MSDEQTAKKIDGLVVRLKKIRIESGLDHIQAAEKCARKWGSAVSTTITYVNSNITDAYGWEYAILNETTHQKKHREELFRRTLDYLSVIGCHASVRREIFEQIRAIYPDAQYKPRVDAKSVNFLDGGLGQFNRYL